MYTFDTDAVAVWINVFFALAVVSALLSVATLVALFVSARSAGSPVVQRSASRLPTVPTAYRGSAATGGAA